MKLSLNTTKTGVKANNSNKFTSNLVGLVFIVMLCTRRNRKAHSTAKP